ncbi:MAG: aldo/keto reductase, partial [Deltaproteobacteria bacterium]|nr:aldo/keto reductase [Deltaproteobacteria bacterium]
MNFGKRTPALEAERIVKRALERGVRVFDTANAYVEGESERIVGRAL